MTSSFVPNPLAPEGDWPRQYGRADRYVECLDLRSVAGNPLRFAVDLAVARWAEYGVTVYDRRFVSADTPHGALVDRLSAIRLVDLAATVRLGPPLRDGTDSGVWRMSSTSAELLHAWYDALMAAGENARLS